MKKTRKTVKTDVRKHRFVPDISMISKTFVDKKTKSKSRRSLKKKIEEELLDG